MEKFRNQIKSRIIGNVAMAVLFLIFFVTLMVLDTSGVLSKIMPDSKSLDFTAGFRCGICTSIIGFAVIKAVMYASALKNETKLKALYIKETDERTQMIMQKTASASFSVTIVGLALASVVASFLSMDILKILVAIIFFIVFVKAGFQFYFTRKY